MGGLIRGKKRKVDGMLVVFSALVFLTSALAFITGPAKAVTGSTKEFIITARHWAYDPPAIEVEQGDEVIIRLKSIDISHGIYVEGYDIRADLILEEGKPNEVVLKFIADKPGSFIFRCSVNCGPFHPFMTGVLKVNPNYTFQGAAMLAVLTGMLSLVYLAVFRR
ncbi:MAG: cupredoxin domain-containing protein [Candidatus Caldarchaeum sp.]